MPALAQTRTLHLSRLGTSRSALAVAPPRSRQPRTAARPRLAVAATAASQLAATSGDRPAVDLNWREGYDKLNAAFVAKALTKRNILRGGSFSVPTRSFEAPSAVRKFDLSKLAPDAAAAAAAEAAGPGALVSHRGGDFSMPKRVFPATERAGAAGSAVQQAGAAPPAAITAATSLRTGGFRMPQRSFPPSMRARSAAAPAQAAAKLGRPSVAASPAPSRSRSASPSRAASPSPGPRAFSDAAAAAGGALRDGGSAFRMPRRTFPQPEARQLRTRTAAAAVLAAPAETSAATQTAAARDLRQSSSPLVEIASITARWNAAADARRSELRGGGFVMRQRRFTVLEATPATAAENPAAAAAAAPAGAESRRAAEEGPRTRGSLGVVAFRQRTWTFPALPALSRLTRSAEARVFVARAASRAAEAKCERLRRELYGSADPSGEGKQQLGGRRHA